LLGLVATASCSHPLGIPAYFYPCTTAGCYWEQLNAAGSKIGIAVINPSSGPGTTCNTDYASQIMRTQSATGANVLGYISTKWGAQPEPSVQNQINLYYDCYLCESYAQEG